MVTVGTQIAKGILPTANDCDRPKRQALLRQALLRQARTQHFIFLRMTCKAAPFSIPNLSCQITAMSGAEALLGIPAAFNACVAILDLVQFGRTFGSDYTRCLFRIEAVGLKLSRWGAAVEIDSETTVSALFAQYRDDAAKAVRRLGEIKEHFDNIQKQCLTDKTELSRDATADLRACGPEQDQDSSRRGLVSICQKMMSISRSRRKGTLVERAKWTLYKKDTFELLVGKLEGSVKELIELFPSATFQTKQTALMESDARQLSCIEQASPSDYRIVAEVLKTADRALAMALEGALKSAGRSDSADNVNNVHIEMDHNSGFLIGMNTGVNNNNNVGR